MARLQASAKKSGPLKTGDADASITLTGCAAGSMITVHVSCARLSTATLGLMNTPTSSPSNTWALAKKREKLSESGSNCQTAAYVFIAANAAKTGGSITVNLATVYTGASDTITTWHVEEWSGMATTNAAAIGESNTGGAAHDGTVSQSGSTGTLSQASGVVFAQVAGPFVWQWNSTTPNTPPASMSGLSGSWTIAHEELSATISTKMPSQAVYQVISGSTAARGAEWTHNVAGQGCAALAVFIKEASAPRRIRITNFATGETPAGTSGWSVDAFSAGAGSVYAREYRSTEVVVSGNDLVMTPAPTGATTGQAFACVAWQPSGSLAVPGYARGIVEEY
jgi:hypothetical protein